VVPGRDGLAGHRPGLQQLHDDPAGHGHGHAQLGGQRFQPRLVREVEDVVSARSASSPPTPCPRCPQAAGRVAGAGRHGGRGPGRHLLAGLCRRALHQRRQDRHRAGGDHARQREVQRRPGGRAPARPLALHRLRAARQPARGAGCHRRERRLGRPPPPRSPGACWTTCWPTSTPARKTSPWCARASPAAAGGHPAPGGGCAAAQPDPVDLPLGWWPPAAAASAPPPARLGRRLRHGAPCRRLPRRGGSAPVRAAAPGASR
jgi:hypothetical protein